MPRAKKTKSSDYIYKVQGETCRSFADACRRAVQTSLAMGGTDMTIEECTPDGVAVGYINLTATAEDA